MAASLLRTENLSADSKDLKDQIPQAELRRRFVKEYSLVIQRQQALAKQEGISKSAEAEYRLRAVQMRNWKMTSLFRRVENEQEIWKAVKEFQQTGDEKSIQQLIDRRISENRRDFHDAEAFTVVLQERKVNGQVERIVFDARAGRLQTKIYPRGLKPTRTGGLRCEMIF